MVVRQAYNGKTKRWVKYKVDSNGWRVTDVKTSKPQTPFKGVEKAGNKRKKDNS